MDAGDAMGDVETPTTIDTQEPATESPDEYTPTHDDAEIDEPGEDTADDSNVTREENLDWLAAYQELGMEPDRPYSLTTLGLAVEASDQTPHMNIGGGKSWVTAAINAGRLRPTSVVHGDVKQAKIPEELQ